MEVSTSLVPRYEGLAPWGAVPEEYEYMEAADIAVGSDDRVYVLTREPSRVLVHESTGEFLGALSDDQFTDRVHGLTISGDDSIFVTDDGQHSVFKFSVKGRLELTIGRPGVPSDTGYAPEEGLGSIEWGGPPFNRPTNVAVGPEGGLYITDGYGNARVHYFSSQGKLINSWGNPGALPGEFNLPHDVCVLSSRRVAVADRENDRIQFFNLEGDYQDEWTHVQRPLAVEEDASGWVYVSELAWMSGERPLVGGAARCGEPRRYGRPSGMKICDGDGNILTEWRSADGKTSTGFVAPHGISIDSFGNIYVAEVPKSYWRNRGGGYEGYYKVRKLCRLN